MTTTKRIIRDGDRVARRILLFLTILNRIGYSWEALMYGTVKVSLVMKEEAKSEV